MNDWLSIPPQLQRDSELAVLALLAATIDVAQHALFAEHPDMYQSEVVFGRAKPIVSLLVAREMVDQMEKLRQSIIWYRLRLEDEEEDQIPDELPF